MEEGEKLDSEKMILEEKAEVEELLVRFVRALEEEQSQTRTSIQQTKGMIFKKPTSPSSTEQIRELLDQSFSTRSTEPIEGTEEKALENEVLAEIIPLSSMQRNRKE